MPWHGGLFNFFSIFLNVIPKNIKLKMEITIIYIVAVAEVSGQTKI